jgi:hypothetical protein
MARFAFGRPVRKISAGYEMLQIGGNGQKYVRLHEVIWEQANGRPKPSTCDIHHINGVKDDNDIDNLVLLSKTDHKRVHAGWIMGSDGTWVAKPCFDCKKMLPMEDFYAGRPGGKSSRCKRCMVIYNRRMREARRCYANR